jgi:hypothetical protein
MRFGTSCIEDGAFLLYQQEAARNLILESIRSGDREGFQGLSAELRNRFDNKADLIESNR